MSQECFSLFFSFPPVDSLPSSRAASVAILPSALLVERFSLGAWWAHNSHQRSGSGEVPIWPDRQTLPNWVLSGLHVIRPRSACDMFGGSHPRRPPEAFL